jgi:hypothetical protein
MNLCSPDSSKSCAACCGLYNVQDGRSFALNRILLDRTRAIRSIPHSVEALIAYADRISLEAEASIIDPAIHVCEYTGFVDHVFRTVGCMLHPNAPDNHGVDFRGLCHYGSMACKTFYCPAFEDLEDKSVDIMGTLVNDWHLYGLVATDINYVSALFQLIELQLGHRLKSDIVLDPLLSNKLLGFFAWKNSWPYSKGSTKRRSAYYFKREELLCDEAALARSIVDSLSFNFDISTVSRESADFVRREIRDFVKAYKQVNATHNYPLI